MYAASSDQRPAGHFVPCGDVAPEGQCQPDTALQEPEQ